MGFKEQIIDDMNVFLDLDVFAKYHNINGQQVLCIIDNDVNKQRSGRESEQYDGIFLSMIKVFVKISDLTKKPVYGKLFKIDDRPYTIIECSENTGMYEITLGWNAT